MVSQYPSERAPYQLVGSSRIDQQVKIHWRFGTHRDRLPLQTKNYRAVLIVLFGKNVVVHTIETINNPVDFELVICHSGSLCDL